MAHAEMERDSLDVKVHQAVFMKVCKTPGHIQCDLLSSASKRVSGLSIPWLTSMKRS